MTNTPTTSSMSSDCSFCGTPHTEVGKLFVGPGVYICDGCVQRLHGITAGTASIPNDIPHGREAMEAAAREMPPDQYLGGLANHARALQQVERDIRAWVKRGVDQGITWDRFAEALELSEDETRRRFSTTP